MAANQFVGQFINDPGFDPILDVALFQPRLGAALDLVESRSCGKTFDSRRNPSLKPTLA